MTKLILAGLMIMAFPACVDLGKAESPRAAPAATVEQSFPGRFQLVQLGTWRSDQLLLDTQTGIIWRSVCLYGADGHGNCGNGFWQKQNIEDITMSGETADQISQAHQKAPLHRQPASR